MRTKKLNLNDLKVQSFVTSLEGKDVQTVKGGYLLPSQPLIIPAVVTLVVVSAAVSATVVIAVKEATED